MPSSIEQVGIILSELSEMFKEELSQGRINGYIEVLRHYDYEDLQYAVKEIRRTRMSHWFPLPAEIINIIHTDRRPTYKALSESEPTPEDYERGKYQCRFAVWLMGRVRTGSRKVRVARGRYKIKATYQTGTNWHKKVDTNDPIVIKKLWLQFLTDQQAPDWLIDEARADMPVEVEK